MIKRSIRPHTADPDVSVIHQKDKAHIVRTDAQAKAAIIRNYVTDEVADTANDMSPRQILRLHAAQTPDGAVNSKKVMPRVLHDFKEKLIADFLAITAQSHFWLASTSHAAFMTKSGRTYPRYHLDFSQLQRTASYSYTYPSTFSAFVTLRGFRTIWIPNPDNLTQIIKPDQRPTLPYLLIDRHGLFCVPERALVVKKAERSQVMDNSSGITHPRRDRFWHSEPCYPPSHSSVSFALCN